MRILLADDDADSRAHTGLVLQSMGYQVAAANDGLEALAAMSASGAPSLVVLDFEMPGLTGPAVCRRFREAQPDRIAYILVLTGNQDVKHVEEALDAGANDYLKKPIDPRELRARLRVGERTLRLEATLRSRVKELKDAVAKVQTLEGLLPICSYCKRIRGEGDTWEAVDSLLTRTTKARVSHSVCPSCFEREIEPQMGDAPGKS
jgi:phosphoserine phosphatase RsbU/P